MQTLWTSHQKNALIMVTSNIDFRLALHPFAAAALMALCGTTFGQTASAPVAAASAPAPARAASSSASSPQAGQADSAAQPQVVYVTANRRRERAQDVAGSVNVLGGYQLEQQGLASLQEWAGFVPGLQVSGDSPGTQRESIRGITTGYLQLGASVATYLDDTPISLSSSSMPGAQWSPDVDPLDVERIEVLKGPQGSLYGASALGGLIKYVTVSPNLKELEGRVELGYSQASGGGGGMVARGAVSIPFVKDLLATRLTVYTHKDPGYVNDTLRGVSNVNSFRNEGARLTTLFKPTSQFDAKLMLDTQQIKSDDAETPSYDAATLRPLFGAYVGRHAFSQPMDNKYDRGALTLNYDLGFANLLSVSSYVRLQTKASQDVSGYVSYLDFATAAGLTAAGLATAPLGVTGALSHAASDQKKKVQEFRLTSPSKQRLEWLAGLFYQDEGGDLDQRYDAYTGTDFTKPAVPGWLRAVARSDLKETAAYANATWHFTDAFDVQAGARYAKLKLDYGIPLLQTYNLLTDSPLSSAPKEGGASENKSTWLISPRWTLDADNMIYARAASGYRPGGPNFPDPSGQVKPPFHSDSIVNYEVGYKGANPAAKLDFSATLYRIDWKDIQVTAVDATSGFAYYANGGKAHSQGIELEAGWRPLSGLRLGANLATTDAVLDEDVPAVSGRAGDEIPYTPKVSAALTGDYSWEVGNGQASIGASYRYNGARRSAFTNQPASPFVPTLGSPILPSYKILDLRGSYAWDRWTVSLFVKNAANARGLMGYDGALVVPDLATGGITPASVSVTAPRSIGVSARADF